MHEKGRERLKRLVIEMLHMADAGRMSPTGNNQAFLCLFSSITFATRVLFGGCSGFPQVVGPINDNKMDFKSYSIMIYNEIILSKLTSFENKCAQREAIKYSVEFASKNVKHHHCKIAFFCICVMAAFSIQQVQVKISV